MKNIFPFIALLFFSFSYQQNSGEDLPTTNQKIIEFCEKNFNKKIDRGECWDLAKFALDYANADWKAPYDFGTVIQTKKNKILPGDIMQFDNVVFESETSYVTFPLHTAIVYEVKSQDKIVMAHQNFNNNKTVQTFEIDLTSKTKGKITFYRPRPLK
ncbi:MAG: hypothetical protein ACWA41_12935 [Putridiphycobacter sp.]